VSRLPRVSVVVIFLDAERFIDEAIRSVLDQTYRSWELLLVDDGSSDGSTEIARAHAARSPQVRYLEHEGHENRGMSASRNLGIRHAKGEYLAFLDADDVFLPDKLEQQVALLDAQPAAGMLYGRSQYWFGWTGDPADAGRDTVQPHRIAGDVLLEPPRALTLHVSGRAAVPCPCGVLARREAVLAVGGFEESFRGMYEDQVFYAKMGLHHPVYVSDACLDRYRQHPESTCSVSASAGELLTWRRRYLEWLRDYLVQQQATDPGLWQALRRETWLARDVRFGPRLRRPIRWLDKWRLRFERRLVPAALRRRIWRRRVPGLATFPG
jgi:glycosyltransferase involved in cell wall biosynthesis